MICFARNLVRYIRKEPIRLRTPGQTIIVTGARAERIDAQFGPDDRLLRLVIYTRQRSARTAANRGPWLR